MPEWVCPDCEVGKHLSCVGIAWDDEADDETRCTCAERDHR